MLNAAALMKALFVSVLVGTFCAILILVGYTNRKQFFYNFSQQDLITSNEACTGLAQSSSLDFKKRNNMEVLKAFCDLENKKWGVFDILNVITYMGKDTIQKSFMASTLDHNLPALYMSNHKELFKISGQTQITGDVYAPNGRVDRANILGNQSVNKTVVLGTIFPSLENLPKLNISLEPNNVVLEIGLDDFLEKNVNYNSFDNPTYHIVIEDDIVLRNIKLKGNFKIMVTGDVVITNSCVLEDIVIEANNVYFETLFEGALQVFAKNEVVMRPNSKLVFPSAVYVESESKIGEDTGITLMPNSVFEGLIVLRCQEIKDAKVFIDKNVLFRGLLYSEGVMETKSNLKGSVYAKQMEVKTQYSEYTNVLLNINLDTLNFGKNNKSLSYSIFSKTPNTKSIILKEL